MYVCMYIYIYIYIYIHTHTQEHGRGQLVIRRSDALMQTGKFLKQTCSFLKAKSDVFKQIQI